MIYHSPEIDSETTLKDNERFYSAKVSIDGEHYFYKKAKDQKLNTQIQKQVKGAALLKRELESNNVLGIETETIVKSGEDWLLTEWLNGNPLAKPEDFAKGQKLGSITNLSKVQVALDGLTPPDNAELTLRVGGNTQLTEAELKMREKVEPLVKIRNWDIGLINDAILFWTEKSTSFKPALQHADLTPWHIYKKDDCFVLIDCEHVTEDWPRFYDVANFYSALNTRFELPEQGTEMLTMFSEARQIDLANEKAFKGIVVLRNIFRLVEHQDEDEVTERIFKFTKEFIGQ